MSRLKRPDKGGPWIVGPDDDLISIVIEEERPENPEDEGDGA